MKKLVYLFVMVAGMTLASYSVNAKDPKKAPEPVKKEATAACCKAGDKAMEGKCCEKSATNASAGKDASTASQKMSDKKGACCMSKTEATASETKGTKVTK